VAGVRTVMVNIPASVNNRTFDMFMLGAPRQSTAPVVWFRVTSVRPGATCGAPAGPHQPPYFLMRPGGVRLRGDSARLEAVPGPVRCLEPRARTVDRINTASRDK
jgi:hypothetical protein